MPERGGPTTQSGILYQNSVTALYLARLCDATARPDADRVARVRAEAPEHVDDTVVTYTDGRTEYVQAKERVRAGDAAWRTLWRHFGAEYRATAFVRGRDRLRLHLGETSETHEALREACDRARTARDAAEWRARLTQDPRDVVDAVAPLLAPELPADDGALHAFFAHVEVETWPLAHIERDLVPHWVPPADRPAPAVFRLLRDRVGGAARVRGTFEARPLRAALALDGVTFAAAPDVHALRAAVRACGGLLRQHKATLGETHVHVPRAVAGEIAAWALDPQVERRVGLLLDHAGRGKTVVMRDVMLALEARGATVLAVKADLQLAGVADADALRQRLGLPEPVERAVARLAADGPVVVIVDQLDALSLSLARDQRSLNTVLDAVARVRAVPGVGVLLSCRTFDRNTDPRLKRVEVGRTFLLPLLDDAEVAGVLAALAVDPASLSPATRALLRTPLHLDLFASLAGAPGCDPTRLRGVRSLQGLYDLLWQDVVVRRDPALPPPAARERVLRAVTARMHRDQRTSVPESVLQALPEADAASAVDALASAGLLVPGATEWTFLHQTFFDYCYARFFVEDGGDLAATVLASDQGLFARPQVVQVLAYLREHAHADYVRALDALLAAPPLRFHLRDLVLRWLGAVPNPSDAEWRLVYRRLLDPAHRTHTMQALGGHPAWFGRLTAGDPGAGALDGLLRSDAAFADASAVPYLASVADTEAQAAVADLVRPWLDRTDPWPARGHYVAQHIRAWRTPNAVALFEAVVDRLPLEQVRHLFELDDVAEADPAAGCRLVRALLDRILDAYGAKPAGHPRALRGLADGLEVLNGSAGQKALASVSTAAPGTFLDVMVPWLERALPIDGDPELRGSTQFYGSDPVTTLIVDEGRVVRHVLLEAYVDALAAVARADGAGFRRTAARLAALPYTTPQLVLTRVYRGLLAADVAAYAGDALAYVLGDARRLRLGENDAYESRMLLRALAPELAPPQLAALEALVLAATGHVHRWYDGLAGLRWRGVDQLHLLRELPRERLSTAGGARLRELERKFPGRVAVDRPTTMEGGFVGPPIPADACARMSDAAWLGAVAKYAHGVEHREFLRGGAMQLARVLGALAKDDPARFARLAARMPDDVDDDYVDALIEGLAASDGPREDVFALVRRFAGPGRPGVHRRTAWALAKCVAREGGLPADLLDLLEGWVRGAPRADEAFHEERSRDLHHGTINTDRGAALRTLMYALATEDSPAALARRWVVAERVANDPSVVLRAGGLDALVYLLSDDRVRAIALFERTVDGHPRLRLSDPFQRFLYHASFGHFARLGPYIRDLMHAGLTVGSCGAQSTAADADAADADAAGARQRGAELAVLGRLTAAGLEDAAARSLAENLRRRPSWGAPSGAAAPPRSTPTTGRTTRPGCARPGCCACSTTPTRRCAGRPPG